MSGTEVKTLELDARADDELDPYQLRLYVRITRMCHKATDGICRDSTQELAEACKMSAGQVVNAKRVLAELGFISIEAGKGKRSDAIGLCSPHEQEASSVPSGERYDEQTQSIVHTMNATDGLRSPHERYEPSIHHMNATALAGAGAVTRSLSSLGSKDKDLKAKDLNTTPQPPAAQSGGGGVDANLPRVVELYEQVTGRAINPIIADELKDDARTYPLERIEEAARLTLLAGKTSWRYTQGILKNNAVGKPRASPAPVIVEKRTRDPALAGFDANRMIADMEAAGTNDKGWNPFEEDGHAEKPITHHSQATAAW
jgi:Putative primosome component and related proteins